MSLLPPTFLPPPGLTMFISPYHLYATSPAAPHPLVAHQASNILRQHSPAINDEHSERGSASSALVSATITSAATTTTTTMTTPAAAVAGVATAAVDDKEDCCESNVNNNNDQSAHNHNMRAARDNASPVTTDHKEHYTKRFYLDRVLESQRASSERSPTPVNPRSCDPAVSPGCNSEQEADYSLQQEQPMDLSMEGTSTTTTCASDHSSEDQESARDAEDDSPEKRRRLPIDLTTKS